MELGIFLIIGILSFFASFYIKSVKVKLIASIALFLFCLVMFIITVYIIKDFASVLVSILVARIFTTLISAMLLNTLFVLVYRKSK